MSSKFSCCGKKDFGNFCCIVCFGIFHPSCLERKTSYIKISGIRIYCSSECQQKHLDEEDKTVRLSDEIDRLKGGLAERDTYIRRLQRCSQDFEDSVRNVEEEYTVEIKNQKALIERLNKELKQTKERVDQLLEDLEQSMAHVSRLQEELQNLNMLKGDMLTSIDALGRENESYVTTIGELRSELQRFKTPYEENVERMEVSVQTDEMRERSECSVSGQPNARVLVLTDSFGKCLYAPLRRKLDTCYGLQLISKPWASFDEIAKGAKCYAESLTQNDYVVVMAGLVDKNLKARTILSLANHCFQTNLLMCTLPVKFAKREQFETLERVNKRIVSETDRIRKYAGNIELLDLQEKFSEWEFIKSTALLNKNGLRKLSGYVTAAITQFHDGGDGYCNLI